MIDHAFLILFCCLGYEIILRSHLLSKVQSNFFILGKVSKVIPSQKISDHWKEIVVPAYAKDLLQNSFFVLSALLSIVGLFAIMSALSSGFYTLALSLLGILESFFVLFIHAGIRKIL